MKKTQIPVPLVGVEPTTPCVRGGPLGRSTTALPAQVHTVLYVPVRAKPLFSLLHKFIPCAYQNSLKNEYNINKLRKYRTFNVRDRIHIRNGSKLNLKNLKKYEVVYSLLAKMHLILSIWLPGFCQIEKKRSCHIST